MYAYLRVGGLEHTNEYMIYVKLLWRISQKSILTDRTIIVMNYNSMIFHLSKLFRGKSIASPVTMCVNSCTN
jgi:hypothetical protein